MKGAQILSEGVAQRSGDMDIVYINGYGFPIWRGGPMCYANMLGLDEVTKRMEEFAKSDEKFWKISPLLTKLATEGSRFGEAPCKRRKRSKIKL